MDHPRRRWGAASVPAAADVPSVDAAASRPARRWSNGLTPCGGGGLSADGGFTGSGDCQRAEAAKPMVAEGMEAERCIDKAEAERCSDDADAKLLAGKAPTTAAAFAAADAKGAKRRQAMKAGGFRALGVQLAEELFRPKTGALSHERRGDLSSLGQTSTVVTTQKLCRDFAKIADGNAVYWPQCLCNVDDLSVFKALHDELAPWEMSPYKRSRHPACIEESRLLTSPTYRRVVAELREVFDIKVGYSIVNLYVDGNDWTEYHRDNFRAEGNRMTASGAAPVAHNVTVGASFGDSRELIFKHLETELEFGFPQGNGDVFAFTEPVNSAFQHCIPKKVPAASAGPRISVILWGRTESHGILRDVTGPGTTAESLRAVQSTPGCSPGMYRK